MRQLKKILIGLMLSSFFFGACAKKQYTKRNKPSMIYKCPWTNQEVRALFSYVIDDITWSFNGNFNLRGDKNHCSLRRDTILLSVNEKGLTKDLKDIYWRIAPVPVKGVISLGQLDRLSTQFPVKLLETTIPDTLSNFDNEYCSVLLSVEYQGLFRVSPSFYLLRLFGWFNYIDKESDLCFKLGSSFIYQIMRGKNGLLYIYDRNESVFGRGRGYYYKESVNSQIYCPEIQD